MDRKSERDEMAGSPEIFPYRRLHVAGTYPKFLAQVKETLLKHVLSFRWLHGHRLLKSVLRLFEKIRRELDIVQQIEEEVIDRH